MDSIITEVTIDNYIQENKIESKEVAQVTITGGDMNMSVYDSNYDGVVDTCQYIDCGTF